MLHICLYLGNDGCLLNVHFTYLTSTGWSDSFTSALIVITVAKALRAAHKALYKQPSLRISCKNLNVSVADCLPDKITSSSFSFGCSGLTLPFSMINSMFLLYVVAELESLIGIAALVGTKSGSPTKE